jgi:hypothetical protein
VAEFGLLEARRSPDSPEDDVLVAPRSGRQASVQILEMKWIQDRIQFSDLRSMFKDATQDAVINEIPLIAEMD